MKHPIIALITDFGTEDGYVGAVKGRILTDLPEAYLVDISHQIQPFDIRQAAFCLNNSYPYFPDKTVFVAVVDPGVGTERRGMMVKTSHHFFVGPDNGIFSFVFHREGFQAWEINLGAFSEDVSPTFHGRDVFAPLAAWIGRGENLSKYLLPLREPQTFLRPPHRVGEKELQLEVLHVDHFGNLILNFHKNDWLGLEDVSELRVIVKDLELREIQHTFAAAPEGELLLCWDSSGFLQIARNQGNASRSLAMGVGDPIRLLL